MQVFTCKQSGISAANAAMATSVAPHQQPAPPTPNDSLSAATSNPPLFLKASADAVSMPPTVGQPNEPPIAATSKFPPIAVPKSPPGAAPKSPHVATPKSSPVAAPKPKLPTVAAPSALLASVHKSPTVVPRKFSTVDEPKYPTVPVLEAATVGSFPVPQQAEMV